MPSQEDQAEYDRLKEKFKAEAQEKKAAAQKDNEEKFTHYVHLANGHVVTFRQKQNDPRPATEAVGNTFTEEDGDNRTVHQVIGVYAREHSYSASQDDDE